MGRIKADDDVEIFTFTYYAVNMDSHLPFYLHNFRDLKLHVIDNPYTTTETVGPRVGRYQTYYPVGVVA